MKNLNEFIVEENLLDILGNHINIELYSNYGKYHNVLLNESLGQFKECDEIVTFITDRILSDEYYDKKEFSIYIDCSKFNSFFHKVNINVKYTDFIKAEFYKQENKKIYLNIYIFEYNEKLESQFLSLYRKILHELLHAYEDFNRENSIFDLQDSSYEKSIRFLKSNNDIIRNISRFTYLFNDQERNAYFSELKVVIEELLKGVKIENFNYSEFRNEIKNTDIWKAYFDCYEFIEQINDFTEVEKKKLADRYFDITNKKLSVNEIKKELNNKWNKFYRKFNQLVPKIVCDVLVKDKKFI